MSCHQSALHPHMNHNFYISDFRHQTVFCSLPRYTIHKLHVRRPSLIPRRSSPRLRGLTSSIILQSLIPVEYRVLTYWFISIDLIVLGQSNQNCDWFRLPNLRRNASFNPKRFSIPNYIKYVYQRSGYRFLSVFTGLYLSLDRCKSHGTSDKSCPILWSKYLKDQTEPLYLSIRSQEFYKS